MKQFYLNDGQQQTGPFSIDELKLKGINRDTSVWKEGMAEWVKAGELSELSEIFSNEPPTYKVAPPPLSKSVTPVESVKKGMSSGVKFFILIVILGGAFLIWNFFIKSSDNSENGGDNNSEIQNRIETQREKTPGELKQELAQKENENPQIYIDAEGTYRENLIGETVLEGKIKNTATVAVFKDIVLEAEFLAPSGTSLGTKNFTRYEKLGPGFEVTFKFKTVAPKETKSVRITVVDATPIE